MEKQKYGFYVNYDSGSAKLLYRINKNFKALINFDQQLPQAFPFPYFIIEYICINCKSKLSRNLMKLCKYLRRLQVAVGFCHLDRIEAEQNDHYMVLLLDIQLKRFSDSYRFIIQDFSEIHTEFPAIKVNEQIVIDCSRKEKIDEFLLSLNLTNLQSIIIWYKGLSLPSNVYDHLLSVSLESIDIGFLSHDVLTQALSKLQKLWDLQFFTLDEITLETFKALINTPRRKRALDRFNIGRCSFDIKAEEVFQFLDSHMNNTDEYTELHLRYMDNVLPREAEIFASEIQTLLNARKEKKIATCEIILEFEWKTYKFLKIRPKTTPKRVWGIMGFFRRLI